MYSHWTTNANLLMLNGSLTVKWIAMKNSADNIVVTHPHRTQKPWRQALPDENHWISPLWNIDRKQSWRNLRRRWAPGVRNPWCGDWKGRHRNEDLTTAEETRNCRQNQELPESLELEVLQESRGLGILLEMHGESTQVQENWKHGSRLLRTELQS